MYTIIGSRNLTNYLLVYFQVYNKAAVVQFINQSERATHPLQLIR